MSKFSGEELNQIAKILATEKAMPLPSGIHGEPPDFSPEAMAEAAAINEIVSGKSNPMGKEEGSEPGGKRLRNKGNMSKAPKGQVEPGEPAPGDDEPEDWEDYFAGPGGPDGHKRKVKAEIKEALLVESEQYLEEGTLPEFLDHAAEVIAEAVTTNQMLSGALEETRTENERLAVRIAFEDFTRGCTNYHREKMRDFIDDFGTWEMARDVSYLQKVSDQVKQSTHRLGRGLNGYPDPLAKGEEGMPPPGAARDTYGEHAGVDPEVQKVIQALRVGPLGTRQG
jgi:hypothetical protein